MKNSQWFNIFSLHIDSKLNKSCEVKFMIVISKKPEPPPPKIDHPFPIQLPSKNIIQTPSFFATLLKYVYPTLTIGVQKLVWVSWIRVFFFNHWSFWTLHKHVFLNSSKMRLSIKRIPVYRNQFFGPLKWSFYTSLYVLLLRY